MTASASSATVLTNPILTVDAVLIGLSAKAELQVALLKRTNQAEPEFGKLALPGGFVRAAQDKSADAAMRRVLSDKLGFEPRHLEQVCTESGPARDPRGWSASVVYLALHSREELQALADRGAVSLHKVWPEPAQLPTGVAFDHRHLISLALKRLISKARYSTLCAQLLPDAFKLSELQAAYEVILGPLNKANFRRKILDSGVLRETGVSHGSGRPAQTYRLRPRAEFLTLPV